MASVTVQIAAGPTTLPYTLTAENGDVRELIAAVRDELNIPVGATPIVNGAAVEDDYVLDEGDEVAFNKPAGEKG